MTKPASNPWQLTAESGVEITIPVRADAESGTAPPESARAFLIREFAHTLGRGTPPEISLLAGYISRKSEDLSGELMPLMEPATRENREQWAEVAAGLHAALGTPGRPSRSFLRRNPGLYPNPVSAQICPC